MKIRASFFILFFLLKGFLFLQAEPQHLETVTFKVYGNCGTCKKTIESALKKNSAVKSADWNVETKMIVLTYDPHQISVDDLHKIIADAGYDTDLVKASESAYKKLPACCRYERNEARKDSTLRSH